MLRRSLLFFEPSGPRVTKTSHPRVFTLDANTTTPSGTVAVIGWLYSSEKLLAKYADVYHRRGMDVVMVTPTWHHVMQPATADQLMLALETEMLAKRAARPGTTNDVSLHAFSMGGYLAAKWTKNMRDSKSALLPCFVTQAYDSPVDDDNVPRGVGEATFMRSPAAARVLERTIGTFLRAFPAVQAQHVEASKNFWHAPLQCPSLWLYSAEDVISPAHVCEAVMGTWEKESNVLCERVVFANTKHVTHFKHHPAQYRDALEKFLDEHRTKPHAAKK